MPEHDFPEEIRVRFQQIRLRKLQCQRQLRILSQKLASNPRDFWTRREFERMEKLLEELDEQEHELLSRLEREQAGGSENVTAESDRSGSG